MVGLEPPSDSHVSTPSPSYPAVRFDVTHPEKLSRGILLLKSFLGWLYILIPHGVALAILYVLQNLAAFAAFFFILFTGKYPKGLFDFVVGVDRWSLRVYSHFLLLNDKYPSFGLSPKPYPTSLEVDNPPSLSKGLAIIKFLLGPVAAVLVLIVSLVAGSGFTTLQHGLILLPHTIILFFYAIGLIFVAIFAWFHILFTGKYPQGVFNFVVGYLRWQQRVNVYFHLQRDEYPPFHGRP